ncbi:ABC transporter permease [Dehalobacter sp. DCM]|uniref:ABC transporter permease n=1 Tax=Dehalobacter sp. DCM TaxID=2907827 RepID=UPI0030817966|nr:ABC transporter permease [Dehalobacter sp. DCM]
MLRIVKRSDISSRKALVYRVFAVLLALVVSAGVILLLGHNPLKVYASMVTGSLGTAHRFEATIIKTIPLVITSLGIAVAFRMKFWNIGGEGQILMGAYAASVVVFSFPDLPSIALLPLMFLAAVIGGGIWALIPAFFKAQFGTNETLFTLMMNYVAIYWVTYLQNGPWKDPQAMGFPQIQDYPDNAILPDVFGIHMGWIIALVLIIVMHIFMSRSKKGYEIAVLGESENTARYAGMNIKKIILIAMLFSGGLCGLTGMIQASAVNNTLASGISGGYGFTAIITAWLGQLSAPLITVVCFLFAILIQGSNYIQTAFQIPQASANIIQGMILFCILGSEFFIQYKVTGQGKQTKNPTPVKEGK